MLVRNQTHFSVDFCPRLDKKKLGKGFQKNDKVWSLANEGGGGQQKTNPYCKIAQLNPDLNPNLTGILGHYICILLASLSVCLTLPISKQSPQITL